MKNKRNFLKPLILISSLSLLFTGCSSKSDNGASSKNSKIEISLAHTWADEGTLAMKEALEKQVKSFEKDHPGVDVKLDAIPNSEYQNNKLKADLAAGNPPDVFYTWGYGYSEPFAKAGVIMDLSDALDKDPEWKNSFIDGTFGAFTYGEGIYGIPNQGLVEGIFYNKKIFEDLNIPAPKNWDQFIDDIKVLKKNNYIPIALGNKDRYPSTFIHNYFYDRVAGNDIYQDILAKKESFVNNDYKEANKYLEEFLKLKPFPEGFSSLSIAEANSLFYQNKAAMYITGSWEASGMYSSQAPKGFGDQVGFVNFPSIEGGKGEQNGIVGGATTSWALSGKLKGEKKEMAIELLKYISNKELSKEMAENAKVMPTVKVDIDEAKTGSLYSQIFELYKSSPLIRPYNDIMDQKLAEVYFSVSQEQFAEVITGNEALQRLQDGNK